MLRPRWIAKLLAFLGGYFWLPCPICGEMFAGFEWTDPAASIPASNGGGLGVCPNCVVKVREGSWKARRLNPGEHDEIWDPYQHRMLYADPGDWLIRAPRGEFYIYKDLVKEERDQ